MERAGPHGSLTFSAGYRTNRTNEKHSVFVVVASKNFTTLYIVVREWVFVSNGDVSGTVYRTVLYRYWYPISLVPARATLLAS